MHAVKLLAAPAIGKNAISFRSMTAPAAAPTHTHREVVVTELLLIVMALVWGANFTVNKYGTQVLPPLVYNSIRMSVGTLAMFSIILSNRDKLPTGAEIKQFVLNAGQHGIELGEGFAVGMEPDDSQNRIGFIHGAIGLNAEMGLGDAASRAQGRVALVAGAGIDAVEYDHGL